MDSILDTCCVCIEAHNHRNEVVKKSTASKAKLSLNRNEFQEIVLTIENVQKVPINYVLDNVKIHCKFMKEGKCSFFLQNHNVRIMLSNCPPGSLKEFLKVLSVKLTHFKASKGISSRKKLLLGLPKHLEYISPLNAKDIEVVNARRDANVTKTMQNSRKRKEPLSDRTNQNCTTILEPPPKKRVLSLAANKLNNEQKHIINIIRQGKNLFFTGSAGTGKSFLLQQIVGILPPGQTFVTASTGVAACHIGGMTLHSFAGMGNACGTTQDCIKVAMSKKTVVKQWRACKFLIVDEISMIDADFFDKMEAVARSCRKNDEPFGGIQLILCGDFFQLPPVSKGKEKKKLCFQSNSWSKCVNTCWELKTVYRQSDKAFIKILQDIRFGRCDAGAVSTLKQTQSNKIEHGSILATKLCTHRENVDQTNADALKQLQGPSVLFNAQDNCEAYGSLLDRIFPDTKSVVLKINTQVMLTKNLDVSRGLVNGARGIVTRFTKSSTQPLPVVKFLSGSEVTIDFERWITKVSDTTFCRRQIPLKLAWAISIHKSQGMSLDCVEMSLSKVFECGQAYVALSRAKSLKGLRVLDFERNCVRSNVDVLRFYRHLRENQQCSVMHPLGNLY